MAESVPYETATSGAKASEEITMSQPTNLAGQLAEAEAKLAAIKRKIAAATCIDIGAHDWKFVGGRNAGCSNDCGCSIPVYQCSRCGDYDYGDNPEAREKIAACVNDPH